MTEKPWAIIFDVDGTLANIDHRRHFVQNLPAGVEQDWEGFIKAMPQDKANSPITWLSRVINGANEPYDYPENEEPYDFCPEVIICTGRSENDRAITEKWLKDNGVFYRQLYMRKPGDFRPDELAKREMLNLIREDFIPMLVFDDRDSVVSMWREAGLTCCQVAPGNF